MAASVRDLLGSVARHVLSYFAEKFGGDPQVGSNLNAWDPVGEVGVLFQEGEITLLGRGADVLQHAVLQLDKFVFKDHLEIPDKFGIVSIHVDEVQLVDLEDAGRFDRFDAKFAGLVRIKATDVGDPVAFGGKLNIVLFARFVDGIQY